ncbi:MAG TPA: HlyD family efflux transporter periplasmic adaptor subunit [Propionicimonas sp.]
MNRRRVIVNSILGVALVGLTVAGGMALITPRVDPNANVPTTKVVRGTLDATVTASGNVESGLTANLQMAGTGGVVTKVYVKVGRKVTVGDKLVAVDDTAAQQQLESALATLKAAEAGLTTATQGRTSAEKKSDAASIASAEQSVKNAQKALDAAKETYEHDKSLQGKAVAAAQDKVESATQQQSQHQQELTAAQRELASTDPSDTAAITALNAKIADLQNQLITDATSLASAKAALASAEQTSESTLLQDRHNVTTQTGSRDAAKKALASTRATVAVARQGAKGGTVASAQAQIDSANVAVDQARTAIEDTVLRAPFDGTVSTVNAVVGQSSGASSTGASDTSGSGLVTLVDPTGKNVTASIAEADVTAVKVGQAVTISLPASGTEMKGKVVSVDPQSTVTDNVVQYRTRVSLESPPATVRVGQTASISITTATSEDVLYLPTSAIATDGTQSYVMKVVDGKRSKVEVTTGMVGTTGTEITSGVAEGDVVVLSNTGVSESNGFPGASASSSGR